jgi:DNA/RNA endonuclease G (NUC1)
MKEVINLLLFTIIHFTIYSQTISNTTLKINHGDIILYLTPDSLSMVSKHTISYSNILKLDKERDDNWFQDSIKSKYKKQIYSRTGYDLGHLTPSHITSYDNILNHASFSFLNQAPQLAKFNRGKWSKLEGSVEDSITKYKVNSIIITGVIYNEKKPSYLNNSKIKIPTHYYKILYINKLIYCWLGSNVDGEIKSITIKDLNVLFKSNGMKIKIK